MKLISRADDLLNPFLVKEVRQSLRSRFFHVIIIGVTMLSAVIVIFGLVRTDYDYSYSHSALSYDYYGIDGRIIFENIFRILWIIVIGFFPVINGIRFYNERRTGEFELFEITGIAPSKIIRGKIQSSFIFSLLIIILCTPFLMICNFLAGISGLEIIFYIGLLIICSIFSSAVGILIGTLNLKRFIVILLFLLFASGIFLSFILIIGLQYSLNIMEFFSGYYNSPGQAVMVILLFLIFYYPLVRLCSNASISSAKKISTIGVRMFFIITGILLFIFSIVLLNPLFSAGTDEYLIAAGYYLLFFTPLLIALFATFKSVRLCPAGLRGRFNAFPHRMFKFLFYPGEGASRIWFSVVLLILFFAETVLTNELNLQASYKYHYSGDWNYNMMLVIAVLMLYSYIGIFINKVTGLIFKHKLSNIKASVIICSVISVAAGLCMTAEIYDAEYFFPFYYFVGNDYYNDFPIEELGWGGFILIVILINLVWGIVLFVRQLQNEKLLK